MNICVFCLRENGHTTHCSELKTKSAATIFTVGYHMLRATMSNYKANIGETDPYLAPMWEKSAVFWCEGAARLIEKAVVDGSIKNIYMPVA